MKNVLEFFRRIGVFFRDVVWVFIKNALSKIAEGFQTLMKKIAPPAKEVFSRVGENMGSFFKNIGPSSLAFFKWFFGGLVHLLFTVYQSVYLFLKELLSNKFVSLIVLFVIVVSVLSVGAFMIVGDNFNHYINKQFGTSIPPNTIKVSPRPAKYTGFLTFNYKKDPKTVIPGWAVRQMANLKGVKRHYAMMASQIPMQMIINVFTLRYGTDLVCIGAPYGFIARDIKDRKFAAMWNNWKPGNPIPALIPRILLDAYNNSMAEPNGLPKIDEKFATGLEFTTIYGKSSIKKIEGFVTERSVCVGFTDQVKSLALVVPLSVVQYYNKMFKSSEAANEYVSVFIEVDSHESGASVSEAVKKMGYIVETDVSLAREIADLKTNVNLIIQILMGIIVVITVIAISFSTIIATLERIEYYRIMRVLGASKIYITLTILFKYAVIGFLGSFLGFFIIDYFSKDVIEIVKQAVKFAGFELTIAIPDDLRDKVLLVGTIVPVLSNLPAIFKLYTKGMSED